MISERVARERFVIGQRVQLSQVGQRVLRPKPGRPTTGVVVGFGRAPHRVAIRLDGKTNRRAFHEMFWDPEPTK